MNSSRELKALLLEQQRKSILNRLNNNSNPGNSLAAWFLGPKGENHEILVELIREAITYHVNDRQELYPDDPDYVTAQMKNSAEYKETYANLKNELDKLLTELKGSVPFWSYRWQSHMNWDLTLPGIAGYFATMLYNPNNVAAEASPVTTVLEMEVGNQLCSMLGYHTSDEVRVSTDPAAWGHITADGSIANNEAMWAARNLKFYPVSLAAASECESSLNIIREMEINLPNGEHKPLATLTTWELLNLTADEILALPERIQTQYGISPDALTEAMNDYSIQNIGFDGINALTKGEINTPQVMAPSDCHYSWPKSAAVLGIGANNLIRVFVDLKARMSITELDKHLSNALNKKIPVLMVVAVIGSTEESAVDPLDGILALREQYRKKGLEFVVHCDAAWGGYFASMIRTHINRNSSLRMTPVMPMSAYVNTQYQLMGKSDSITIDPHKAGYIPYPAGGLCYRNGAMRNLVAFTAPVVYHGGVDPTVGVYGLEGSKPGAAAAAVYLSHKVIPLDQSGYGKILGQCMFNSKRLYCSFVTMAEPEDNFIMVPFQQYPEEFNGKNTYNYMKTEIVPKTNEEIYANQESMELMNEIGSDQIIITYAFNFKVNGVLNTDVELMNTLNLNIFKALSLSPDHDNPAETPIYVTQSQFTNSAYGPDLVNDFKSRLGVKTGDDTPVNFIISTTMDPWITDTEKGNFIPTLTAAYKKAIIEQVDLLIDEYINKPAKG